MRRDVLAAGAAALAVACDSAFAAPAGAPMSFEELMRAQRSLDAVSFSPDGHHLLYIVRRNDIPSDGIIYPPAAREAWIADLESGRRVRVGGPQTGGYEAPACGAWAPDGSGVALLTDRQGVESLAYYDLRRARLRVFAERPSQICPKWAGRFLVYAAAAAQAPAPTSKRLRTARASARWMTAWTTSTAQVSMASNNPAFPAPPGPEPGLAYADPVSGRSGRLARGNFSTIAPSPDGRTVAVIKAGAIDAKALDRFGGRRGVAQVYRISARGGRLLASFPEYDAGAGGLAWSADGRRLLIGARAPGAYDPGLFVYDLAARSLTPAPLPDRVRLAPERPLSALSFYQLGWIAGCPAYIAAVPGDRRAAADVSSDYGEAGGLAFQLFVVRGGRPVPLSGFTSQAVTRFAATPEGDGLIAADGALWRVRPGAPPRRVTGPEIFVLGITTVTPGPEDYVEQTATGGAVSVILRDTDGRTERAVIALDSGAVRLAVPDREFGAWSPDLHGLARLRREGWATRLEVEGARPRTVAVLNAEWRDRPVGALHEVHYRAAGRDLTGWVLTPPGYAGGRLPAVEWIYGGQLLGAAPGQAGPNAAPNPVYDGQLWAAQGYAVIYPSTPTGDPRKIDVPSTLADEAVGAIDAAAAAGLVDPDRVGLIGHSFGGFSAAAVLSRRSDRFRAGIAMDGIYDLFTAWGSRSPLDQMATGYGAGFVGVTRGLVEEGQAGLRAPPWRDPSIYLRTSPMSRPEAIRTPLMLAVGDLDGGATGLNQSERFYAALQRTGNPAVLLRYWGEGHVQEDPGAMRDEWRRFTAWFAHYLKAPPGASEFPAVTPRNGATSGNPGGGSASGAPRPPPPPPT